MCILCVGMWRGSGLWKGGGVPRVQSPKAQTFNCNGPTEEPKTRVSEA